MRWLSGLLGILILLMILKLAWPLIVAAIVFFLVCFVFAVLRQKKLAEQYPQNDEQKQVNEDFLRSAYTRPEQNPDIIEAEYTEREADQ